MAETTYIPNFNGLSDIRAVVYDTEVVPHGVWAEAQEVQRESLRFRLPRDEQDKADELVNMGNTNAYRESRVNPNRLVGKGFNGNQMSRDPVFTALIENGSNQLVGGVLTADNTSASPSLPRPLRSIEYRAKMMAPPGIPIPKIGNRRYVHLREAFAHPDAQKRYDLDDESREISGITLAGLYYSLAIRHDKQPVAAYEAPDDPADRELSDVTEALNMNPAAWLSPDSLPGYEGSKVRVVSNVGQIMKNIIDMPSARPALNNVRTARVTAKVDPAHAVEMQRQNEEYYWRRH